MAATGRIVPGTSTDIEMGAMSVTYRGGALSSLSPADLESRKNRMTLEEARWTGVRKKIPGMSGIPIKQQSPTLNTGNMSSSPRANDDPYAQKLEEVRNYARQHFHQKECMRFVPKPGQTTGPKAVKRVGDLKCHCGEVLTEHDFVPRKPEHEAAPRKSEHQLLPRRQSGMNVDRIEDVYVPKEIKDMMRNRQDPPPANIPELAWSPAHIHRTPTTTFGKMNFENVEHARGKKPAKYIRMTDDDNVDNLLEMMEQHWRIMEPERPNLVISVIGGAKNFKLDGRMRDTFSTGLIKAAKTTSAWLISSGFNMGVMKSVGQAVRDGQSFCWDNDRMVHVLRCIGIAPWGYVIKRRDLESEREGKFNANYRTSNVILHDSAVPLNPDHTHFIFVDDGYRIRYGGVAGVRAQLEQKISQPVSEKGLGIPVVLVVVEGGTDAINDAQTTLEHKIPVVVCAGTGRAADILAYAYTHTKTQSGGMREMKDKHELKLMGKIYDAYGKAWKGDEEIETKTTQIKDKVRKCCEDPDMMTVFHMNKHEDLDLAILSVLLKAKKGMDEPQRLSQLKLALMWDRVDIAQEEIFREDVLWSTGSLDDILTEALLTDKVKFVELILQQGTIVMKEFLTEGRLLKLYTEIQKQTYLHKLMHRLTGKDNITLNNVFMLLRQLLDKFDTEEQIYVTSENGEDRRFHRPYKMLLLWALLMNRQQMAKLFWELGEEPVTSALVASRIYHSMARKLPRHESNMKENIIKCETEFEMYATQVLDECYQKDPDKAMMICERKSPCWNEMTCLQIAAAALDQKFLSSNTCYSSINMTWKHGILAPMYKIMIAMIFPPFIAWKIEILSLGEGKLSAFQKLGAFYTSPMAKFAHGMVMYITFLFLHSYLVLVDFKPNRVTPLEWVIFIWVLSFFVDEIHTFLAFPSPTVKSKIRDWFGYLKWLDVFNFVLAFVGFIIHGTTNFYYAAKVMYCINSIIFFLRIMKIYISNGQLGPKIFMIQQMLDELRMFIMVLLVFLLAYGVASQGLLYHMRTADWSILKDVVYFPYWQLYGEIFFEEIDSDGSCTAESTDCRTFHWLVPFLLAAYLLVGNILLLNLLIAIFSHVFETVEKNSHEIWKYQMYFLVMEYENKTWLVPPFSLIQHVVLIFMWIFRKSCLHRKKGKQHFGKRHLEYLQLFEKEMMMNYLRQVKAHEMSGVETTVNRLQKRVDELTKLIEDEVIADQQPAIGGFGTTMIQPDMMCLLPADDLAGKPEKTMLEPVPEEKEKKKKHKKKHKHKDKHKEKPEVKEKVLEENKLDLEDVHEDAYEMKLSNISLPPNIPGSPYKPEPPPKVLQGAFRPDAQPRFAFGEDSGTDNALVTPERGSHSLSFASTDKLEQPVSPGIESNGRRTPPSWRSPNTHENNLQPRQPLRKRFSSGIQRQLSSNSDDSEDDSRLSHRFSLQKYRQKKSKKRSSRYGSDSD